VTASGPQGSPGGFEARGGHNLLVPTRNRPLARLLRLYASPAACYSCSRPARAPNRRCATRRSNPRRTAPCQLPGHSWARRSPWAGQPVHAAAVRGVSGSWRALAPRWRPCLALARVSRPDRLGLALDRTGPPPSRQRPCARPDRACALRPGRARLEQVLHQGRAEHDNVGEDVQGIGDDIDRVCDIKWLHRASAGACQPTTHTRS
jgi:hypothetical protein